MSGVAIDAMPIGTLRALDRAMEAAIAAGTVLGHGFDAAVLIDAEGVSVVFTVPLQPQTERTFHGKQD